MNRSFVQLLAASIAAGFMLQAEWAIDHDFEHFAARVFAAALVLFIVLQAVRAAFRQFASRVGDDFDRQYGESLLLLSVMLAFMVVDNLFLRTAGMLAYGVIVVLYLANVLQVGWAGRVEQWTRDKATLLFRVATQAPLSYVVQDDVDQDVLYVSVATRRGAELSHSEIERRIHILSDELPTTGRFKEIKVDVDGVADIDETLPRLLEPLSRYAAQRDVLVISRPDRMDEVAAALPADDWSVKASGS